MAEILRMPEVLAGAAEASIQAWLVRPGSTLVLDQPIAEVETEKATVELTAESAGALGRILVEEGENVAVGDPIAVLLADGEGEDSVEAALKEAGLTPHEPAAASSKTDQYTASDKALPSAVETSANVQTTIPEPVSGRRFVSPLVRRLARQNGVDLDELKGTGPEGRIVRRDLERFIAKTKEKPESTGTTEDSAAAANKPVEASQSPAATASSDAYVDVPTDRMRKAIARRLTQSKTTVPHFYLTATCRVDALLKLRQQVNQSASKKVSINDFVLKAVAGALVEVPEANSIWLGESVRRYSSVDIAVAVATEGGLTTPVLRGVERMSLSEISSTVVDMAERARAGRLRQHELEGGSFSVSNLGMYGTEEFSAILNPPQSGILAVGTARNAPVVSPEGELEVGTVMTVTLSADHRVLDGAVAAQWLSAFQRRIENPLSILV
ncbi:dihydrolipoamide acetyltransferase family protein [Arthrobacter sp. MI7-26]|uniref:dihydrolipoamide acetyltransferase family protein n=1 Tax=Arthrobacter sp. MI7-26 TaxID=2993653 RepID=UPI0022487E97|nr:dihydrolipoamide acetyltransferase family protein [Arthrobacter sp. MI7-26]MCX2750021.1 dihydrolipoamide acetyltransferase family protein [Arthrobacter sp. MI7-26]